MRSCNGCTMCCRLLEVTELQKPRNRQCTHCAAGGGCTIYDTRPAACREFSCLWLLEQTPEWMAPAETRVVLDRNTDGTILMHCDPHRDPLADKRVQMFLTLCRAQKTPVVIVQGERLSTLTL